jgi:hypothetical protein
MSSCGAPVGTAPWIGSGYSWDVIGCHRRAPWWSGDGALGAGMGQAVGLGAGLQDVPGEGEPVDDLRRTSEPGCDPDDVEGAGGVAAARRVSISS